METPLHLESAIIIIVLSFCVWLPWFWRKDSL